MADTQAAASEGVVEAADLRLAAAVLRKDRKATAEFVERYSDAVYGYVYRRLVPRTDLLDDLVQEVFLAAWSSLGAYEGRSPLKSWLLGIARHKVQNHYRSVLREPVPLEEEIQERMAVEPLHDQRMDRRRLAQRARRVIEAMPETYAAALLWRYWEKRSAAEMAEQTGKTAKAIERILARAREQFKRRWKHEVSA